MSEMDSEDAKIIALARSTRARTGAAEGAAVRDETGRTYAAATVDLPSLKLTALQVAVAMAASSGAESLEAAALVTTLDTTRPEDPERPGDIALRAGDIAAVRDLGPKAPILIAGPNGALQKTVT